MNRPPRRALRGFCVAGAIVGTLLAAGGLEIAAADDGGEPIRLEYRAAPGCPDEAAFVARIRARTARARLVGQEEQGGQGGQGGQGEHARTFTVQLAAGAHPSGSVTVTDGARSEGTRRLDADSCDDVADALALMVALALDPHALSAPAPPPAPTPPPDDLDSGVAPVPDAAALPDSAERPPAPAPPPPPVSVPDEATTPPDTTFPRGLLRRELNFFAGVDFVVAQGVAPSVLLTGAPYVGWRTTRASLLGARLGASIRAAFLRVGTGTVDVSDGSAAFTWTVGRIDGCAMLWPDRRLRLGACARAEVGILDASGEGSIPNKRTQHSPWVAVGTLARLEWSFLGPLMLDLEVGPDFHITADQFYFLSSAPPPITSGYTVPIVGLDAEAGLAVHFL